MAFERPGQQHRKTQPRNRIDRHEPSGQGSVVPEGFQQHRQDGRQLEKLVGREERQAEAE
jgi:hypothetical protein